MHDGDDAMSRPLRPSDPRRLGTWHIVSILGEGGMGIVYSAIDDRGRHGALKVVQPDLHLEDSAARERFEREVRLATQVAGTHLARVLDHQLDAEQPYLVTELIEGITLRDEVTRKGALDIWRLRSLAGDLLAAIATLSEAGITHRDLKPSNVMLSGHGAVVLDLGIASAADSERLTQTGRLIGTPAYMAPEQFSDPDVIAPAIDVFAWASVVYFAATGKAPFHVNGANQASIGHRVMSVKVDYAAIESGLRPLVESAHAKQPQARPSAAKLLESVAALAKTIPPVGDASHRTVPESTVDMYGHEPGWEATIELSPTVPHDPPNDSRLPDGPRKEERPETTEDPNGHKSAVFAPRPGTTLQGNAETSTGSRPPHKPAPHYITKSSKTSEFGVGCFFVGVVLVWLGILLFLLYLLGTRLIAGGGDDGDAPSSRQVSSNEVAASIDLQIDDDVIPTAAPSAIAASPNDTWVVNGRSAVSWLSSATNELVAQVTIGPSTDSPEVITAGEHSAWVVLEDGAIGQLDPVPDEMVDRITIPGESVQMVSYDGTDLWVGTDDEVYQVDPISGSVTSSIALGSDDGLYAMAASQGVCWVILSDLSVRQIEGDSGEITEVRTSTSQTEAVDVAAIDGAAWILNYGDRSASRVDADTAAQVQTIDLNLDDGEDWPHSIAVTDSDLWITTEEGRLLRVNHATGEVTDLDLGSDAGEVAATASAVWVTDAYANKVLRVQP